jgi:hypothetical protein
MDDRENRFVDELVAASLQRYAGAEARPGLEERVLAGVRARQQAERRRRTLTWAVGMAAVAAMVSLLMIYWPRRQPVPSPVAVKAPAYVSAPAIAQGASPVQLPVPHKAQHQTVPKRVDTRPPQFPTPRPLSQQEKLLVEYVQSLKDSSGVSAPDADQGSEGDVEIPPIKIAAIRIDPLPSSESGNEK